MSVWAVSMMKDEIDVAVDVVRHMASEGVDAIVVADNLSTDGTLEALNGLEAELEDEYPDLLYLVCIDGEPAYYQSQKMTGLAQLAADNGATWIIPFDADELWHGNAPIGEILRAAPPSVTVVEAQLFNYYPTDVDPPAASPFQRIVHHSTEPGALPKVAFRWQDDAVIEQGNHGVALPRPGIRAKGLQIAHFPYRSFEQFVTKAHNGAAAYALTDLPAYTGDHWRGYGRILDESGEEALRAVFDEWFHFPTPDAGNLKLEPAPFRRWSA